MKKEEIFEKVKFSFEDYIGLDEDLIVNEANLKDDLGLDSLDVVELIMEYEKEFNISVPDEDIDNIKTIENIVDYLYSRIS
jgi:acyl carrier protein